MTRVYNRTLTPLPADADGRLIEGRSEGEVDESYAPVARAIEIGSFREVEKASSSSKTKTKKSTSTSTTKKATKTKASESDSDSEPEEN